MTEGACEGLGVLECATMVSGPFGGQVLGDLGAEVIKVEPINGDPLRGIPPRHEGMSAIFANYNRNKKSIALDLKSPEGNRVARELIATADVLLENNRNGVMARLGLDYETLAKDNPKLIYLSLTGFGPDGPYSDRPAYEHLLQGYSGLMRLQGGDGDPVPVQNTIIDKSSALLASNAILAALLYRTRSGKGQKITLSLMAAAAQFALSGQTNNDTFLAPGAPKFHSGGTMFPVATKDGHIISYFQQRQHFVALCKTFGREDLIEDPRFQTDRDVFTKLPEIFAEMGKVSQDFTTAELVERAAKEGVPLAPINSVEQFFDDPQVQHSAIFSTIDDPQLGPVRLINYAPQLSETPATIRSLPPTLGADTDAMLSELGYDAAAIATLRETRKVA